MSKIFFNQQVSPRLYRTNNPPSAKTQEFYYENHLEDRLKELNHNDLKMLENIETLQEDQHKQKAQSNQIQNRLDHIIKQFTNKVNEIITQITDIKQTNSKQNDRHLKNFETQQALLQAIDERQQKIEQSQIEETDRTQLLLKEMDRKMDELTLQVADIKNLSETHQALFKSIEERQIKFEENQNEEADLTQLLFQELTKKINEITSRIDEIKSVGAQQTDSLLEHHELQEAFLESMEERQVKIEEQQRVEMDHTQSVLQEISELKNNQHMSQRA